MKRIPAFLLVTVMLLSVAAAAGADPDLSDMIIANGTLQAAEHVDITAPFSGTLKPFSVKTGDVVHAGDELFSFLTQSVYAPEDGEITAVFAQPGMYASSVIAQYGALGALEPVHQQIIQASTNGAYNKNKNKEIHVGETLYFRTTGGTKEDGEGIVPGVMLVRIILKMCEFDTMIFVPHVTYRTILLSSAVTFAFTWFIEWLLTRKVRGIDMVEALKSVE